jgi:hypothetical protein
VTRTGLVDTPVKGSQTSNTTASGTARSRFASRLRDITVVLSAVAVGFGLVLVPRLLNDSGGDNTASPAKANPRVQLSRFSDARVAKPLPQAVVDPTSVEAPGPPAPSAIAAITGFLDAEVARDFAVSYGGLSAADRERAGSHSEWADLHAQLPAITRFTLGETRSAPGRAEVEATVDLKAGLDEIVGLVPARAHAVWVAVAEDGGWRVDFESSELVPTYPPDADAIDAARSWVSARSHCRRAPQYRDGLLGVPAIAAGLCGAHGPVRVGTPATLHAGVGVEPFVAAFGAEVFGWARTVPVQSPLPMQVVLAPIGDRWGVIGVLESLPGSSP